MSVLNIGTEYQDGDTVTSSNLNALITDATFSSTSVDETSTSLSGGSIIVKDGGINKAKLAVPIQGIIEKSGTAYLGADKTGNTRGSSALDIQSGRTLNTQVASGTNSLAVGYGNTAGGSGSVAIGKSNNLTTPSAGEVSTNVFACGISNYVDNSIESVAIGKNCNVDDSSYSSAIGASCQSDGSQNSASIGINNYVSISNRSVALGISCETQNSEYSSAIGYESNVNEATRAVALGIRAKNYADDSIEVGLWEQDNDIDIRLGGIKIHNNNQCSLSMLNSSTAPTAIADDDRPLESGGELASDMFTIQRNGNDLTLYVNDGGTIKSLSLGTLA